MAAKDVRIVVLQRGWVVVGEYAEREGMVTVNNGSVIRTWGTDNGLGQLVSGPTDRTVLDPLNEELECNPLQVVFTLRAPEFPL